MLHRIIFAAALTLSSAFATADNAELVDSLYFGAELLKQSAYNKDKCRLFVDLQYCQVAKDKEDAWVKLSATLPIREIVDGEYDDDAAVMDAMTKISIVLKDYKRAAAELKAWVRANQ